MATILRRTSSLLFGISCVLGSTSSRAEPPRLAPVPTPQVQARPASPPPGPKGVSSFVVGGFSSSTAKGTLTIKGVGPCRLRADIFDKSKPNAAANPVFRKFFIEGTGTTLPVVIPDIGPLPNGAYRAYLIGYDQGCPVQGPDKNAGGWYVDFNVGAGPAAAPTAPSTNGNANGAPPSTGGAGGPATGGAGAKGNSTGLSVPGGSFAQDEAQKLLVAGSGFCALDLTISSKAYGGGFEKTFPVPPMTLPTTLYNGTHFDTLAEGSYKATATGKGSCTGTGSVDFKVTPKTSTKTVPGKLTITFDPPPKSGGVFSKSKDGNVTFKVTAPQSVKGEPSATCCELELDFQNAFGGWEPLPSSPFQDPSYGLAITQPSALVSKSVSYFSQGTVWRVKMRAYKYKTEFEWSDWVEFRVNQQ